MLYEARVEVGLKPGHSDPEGETTAHSLKELTYPIKEVKISKTYTITLEANSHNAATIIIEEICKRMLANPTKDSFNFKVAEVK